MTSNYTPRRVQILTSSGTGYFKKGQFAYVLGENRTGGMHFVDCAGESSPGETAYLVSKSKNMAGGALWFSSGGLKFTGRVRKATSKPKRSYGERSTCDKCESDIEWSGREHGWTDRGGNSTCNVYFDRKLDEYVRPKGKHRPVKD